MKRAIVVLAMCALTVVFGCKATSERGGAAPTDQGFKIVTPAAADLKQGEAKTVAVRLDRGNYFKRDVRLTMMVSGQGVTVDPAEKVILASDPAEVQVRVAAAPNAAVGEYRVSVTGTPQDGMPTSVQFPVRVKIP